MRLLGSFLFLVGALSVGAYAYFPQVVSPHPNLINVVEIETPTTRTGSNLEAMRPGSQQTRSFSPIHAGFRQIAEVGSVNTSAADTTTEDSTQTAVGGGTWQTSVTVVAGDSVPKRRSSMTPSDWHERVELARSLQSELKRVGCYSGNVDGDWGGASKRAMTSFLQKVNATLPVEAPDYILLTLIQGHADKACGIECPSNQGMAGDGRCIPNVIVARGPGRGSLLARKTTGEASGTNANVLPADRAWAGTTTVVTAAAPPPEPATTLVSAPRAASNIYPPAPSISVAHAAPTTAAAPAASPAQAAENRAPAAPLPGRMAIGAPAPAEAEPAVSPTSMPPQHALAAPYVAPRQVMPRGIKNAALSTPEMAGAEQVAVPPSGAPGAVFAPPKAKRAVTRPRLPSPPYARPERVKEYRSSGRRNDYGTVRTSQGKVRRGSPTHNLMLSLGGVF